MSGPGRTTKRLIKASEIGQYVYCQRAWWLAAVAGEKHQNVQALARGVQAHAGHGRLVSAGSALRWVAIALAVGAVLLVLMSR
jgi:hypothetical protein